MLTNEMPFQSKPPKTLLKVMQTETVNVEDILINDDGKQLLIGLLKANKKERKWDIIDPQKPRCSKWLQKKQVQKKKVGQSIDAAFIKEEVSRWRQQTLKNLHDDIVEKLSGKYEDLVKHEDSDFNDDSKGNEDGVVQTKSKFELLMDRVAAEFLFGVLMESMKEMKKRKSKNSSNDRQTTTC